MKNKKAIGTFGIIMAAIISMILLLIFVGPIIKGILVDQQIAFAGAKTQEITIDCDGDEVIGFSDLCPCNKDIQNKEDLPCGDPDSDAKKICPKLCKR